MPEQRSKVLIVDDQEYNRLSFEFILGGLDIEIFHANSGEEALTIIHQHEFAVLLMDVVMPGLDGYETTRKIRAIEQFKEIPIVMVSAHDNVTEQYLKAYEAGAVDYISKPVEPIVLINKVKQFVELFQQRHKAQLLQIEHEQDASRMQGLLNSAGEGILGIDPGGTISFANPKAAELLEIEIEDLVGLPLEIFLQKNETKAGRDAQHGLNYIINLLRSDRSSDNKKWFTHSGGSFYVEYSCEVTKDERGTDNGGVVTFQNVTERKATEAKLIRLANYDPLTNLANRASFHDSLARAIARSKRTHSNLTLFYLDLDHFKAINDTMGHDAGDMLLEEIGRRLVKCIRSGDIAARIGGDEFAIILYDLDSISDITKLARKVLTKVHEPIYLPEREVVTGVSLGIAVFNDHSMSSDQLVKAADTAMYIVKKEGRNSFQFYEPEMQDQAVQKSKLQNTLDHAIHHDELCIYYQPKISISSDKIIGMEALVRWKDRHGALHLPETFIPLAEESGQIHELGRWVLNTVCEQIAEWKQLPGFEELVISVNISEQQLRSGHFPEIVASTLKAYNLDGSSLELEMTETAVMNDARRPFSELQAIHDLGIGISIDDFGTGYSSLNYLKRFPVQVLTIDRCFVEGIGEDHHDEEILRIIVAIARTLNIHVIAEGVETTEQLAFLYSLGCDFVQGSFFSEPLDKHAATQMIDNIKTSCLPCFEEFHTYRLNNNIQPPKVHQLHQNSPSG